MDSDAIRATLPLPKLTERAFGGIPAFTDDALFEAVGVRIAFTTRAGGVSVGPYDALNFGSHVEDDLDRVLENRALFLNAVSKADAIELARSAASVKGDIALGDAGEADINARIAQAECGSADTILDRCAVEEALVVPNQVHGDKALTIEVASDVREVQLAAEEGADAIIVNVAGVGALLCFADCVPVVIVLPTGRFAVVHAGWRGVENEISAKTLSLMLDQEIAAAFQAGKSDRQFAVCQRDFADQEFAACQTESVAQESADDRRTRKFAREANALRAQLAAGANIYIGPYIHRECFETSPDVHDLFTSKFGDSCSFDPEHIDLGAALRTQLVRSGVDEARICDIDACTVCNNDRFFSFRAQDGVAGRHGAFAIRR